MSTRRPVRSGAVLMSLSQVVTAVTGFVTTIAIARILGPDGVGAYTVAVSILVIGAVASLGVEHGMAWAVAGERWPPRAAVRASRWLALGLGAAAAAIFVGVQLLAPDAFGGLTPWLVLVVAAGIPAMILWQYLRSIAVALDRYEAFVVPPALASALALALCAAGAAVDGVRGVCIGLLLAHGLTAMIALVDATRRAHDRAVRPLERPLRSVLGFGLRANAANALQILNYRVDLFVLSAVASQSELGLYAAAVSVTSVMLLAPQTLASVVFPRVAALTAGGESELEQRAMVESKSLRHVSLLTLLSLPLVGAAMAVGIPLLYGSAFDGSVLLGLILLPGVAVFAMASVLSATINGRGHPEYSLRVALIATPVALALYAGLIPPLGDLGAAIASTGSYALTFALTVVYYRRATGDRALPLLVPTREEVADLRALLTRASS